MNKEEKFIHLRDALKDFDNETDVDGEKRFHSLIFVSAGGNVYRLEKVSRAAPPQKTANVKTLRNCLDEFKGKHHLFNFRLLIGFNGMKVMY
jgi:hypothetical protein